MADGKDSGLASGTSGSPQLSLDNECAKKLGLLKDSRIDW